MTSNISSAFSATRLVRCVMPVPVVSFLAIHAALIGTTSPLLGLSKVSR